MTAAQRAHGPYETEAAAMADLESLAASAGLAPLDAGRDRMLMLRQTLEGLGVEAGSFDLLILARFAHWEPDAVIVVRGLLERAHTAGQRTNATAATAAAASGSAPPAQPGAAEDLVHWARQGGPLGDPAQCGAPEGRATRVASAVTCPACVAWMHEESWGGHCGTEAH